ncbi:MAG TPA: FAD/NAD(P)-binding oxidoreductase, partial [Dehalococcoidales bacterium]|nr:FAD/NAD(P)-binding oxidoreductase [Dehalococcoidales bacterium]
MGKRELIIVGGSAGGVQAAICAQKHHDMKDVLVIRRENKVMVPCGIPYIYGTLGTVEMNIMPDKLLGEAELRVGEVVSIDRNTKTVTLKDGEVVGYNKLILATGSNPVMLPVPGIDKKNVFFVRKDTDYLRELSDAVENARHILVIGGGFIGVEFADECRKRGCEVTLVEILEHCLQLVCIEELCIRVEDMLKERGVNVVTK